MNMNIPASSLAAATSAELSAAFCSSEGAVILSRDITVGFDAGIIVSRDVYLNLNGYTLSRSVPAEGITQLPCLFEVTDGTLTIENGIIDCEAGNNSNVGIDVNGENAAVVINSGSYYGAFAAVRVRKGSLTVNGGFFDLADTYKSAFSQYAECTVSCFASSDKTGAADITVKGGTFVNFNPSHLFRKGGASSVAVGCKVICKPQANGDVWYIVVSE